MRPTTTAALGLAAIALLGAAAPLPTGYLSTAERPDVVAIAPQAPAADSAVETADRDAYRRTRALAGGPRWAQAVSDVRILEPGAFESWSCAAGVAIGPDATPATWKLLRRSVIDAGLGVNPGKIHYNRPRPFMADDGQVCVARESLRGSASYPSGHAAVGWAWALILSELKPARASEVLVRGREFGDSRVVCGVHFPSDVEAGRLYGAAVVARLHAAPEFVEDLAAAKAELAKAPPASCGG